MQHLRDVIPPQPCWPSVDRVQAPAIGDSPHHAINPAVAPQQPTILPVDTDINKPNARRVSRSPPGLGRVYHGAHTSHTNAPSQHAAPPQPALPPNDTDHDLARTAGIIPHTIRACGAPQQPSSPPIVKDPALAASVPCQDTSIYRLGSISPRPRGKLHGGDQNLHSNAHPPPLTGLTHQMCNQHHASMNHLHPHLELSNSEHLRFLSNAVTQEDAQPGAVTLSILSGSPILPGKIARSAHRLLAHTFGNFSAVLLAGLSRDSDVHHMLYSKYATLPKRKKSLSC